MTCMLQSSLHFLLSYAISPYKSPQISQISWILVSSMPMSFPYICLPGLISIAVSWTLPSPEMEPPWIGLESLNSIVFLSNCVIFISRYLTSMPHTLVLWSCWGHSVSWHPTFSFSSGLTLGIPSFSLHSTPSIHFRCPLAKSLSLLPSCLSASSLLIPCPNTLKIAFYFPTPVSFENHRQSHFHSCSLIYFKNYADLSICSSCPLPVFLQT